ncbi:hypothetical protein BJ684DRAFT_20939 [Piptocephalis cylindrospora]|uniref:Ricin B lectin domain-containing protein n=1 Tax=Piptocephalis cylindrospora TaxID=1907219 RepID=A0A4P9Y354_9FUNG|nr:hypothetical protein BJ684DRAFT_20939 [Piptocephalis cylindrospora]|eukprot:RKP12531.1 hypothetical protein BJ684DRAFT_20939 [Piptocephalis cylindrospora]
MLPHPAFSIAMISPISLVLSLLVIGAPHALALPTQPSAGNVCTTAGEGAIVSYCLEASVVPSANAAPQDIPSLIPSDMGLRAFPFTDDEGAPGLRLVADNHTSIPPVINHIGEGTAMNCRREQACDIWPIWDDRRINPTHACNLTLDPTTKHVKLDCPNSIVYSIDPTTDDGKEVWTVRTNDNVVVGSYTRIPGSSGDGKVQVDVTKPSGRDNNWHLSLLVDFAIAIRLRGGFSS